MKAARTSGRFHFSFYSLEAKATRKITKEGSFTANETHSNTVQANFKDGVLEIILPAPQQNQRRQMTIQ
jgi:HSP20 family molecular chaperone IbpA